MHKFILLFNTLKYLKAKQIYYRLFYFARARYRKTLGSRYNLTKDSSSVALKLDDSLVNQYSSVKAKKFKFLNLEFAFQNSIDWNFLKYGKLWTYNLTYFEYLKEKDDIWLVYDFINSIDTIRDGLEPFPISLRGMNWIKFVSKYDIKDKKIDNSLYAQYYILLDNLEYHLLGNHLLENGFSLLFGAYYFQDELLYQKAKEILRSELEEQILNDGGHFELSPMYHQLMLFRLLDCINIIKHNNYKNQELLEFLSLKAEMMLAWLKNITYANGEIPLLNDSANHIAPTTLELVEYANRLEIVAKELSLKESGYRRIEKSNYEAIVDIGSIGPSYIPGHAHADTFNFEIRVDGKPFIVDSGLSTYETNERRFYERSTHAHNTVEVQGKNSSEVWGGFRVADRARVIELEEKENYIKVKHDGYSKIGVFHTRSWEFQENKIVIHDMLNKDTKAVFHLHFHPTITKQKLLNSIISQEKIKIVPYQYANEFNKHKDALSIEIDFTKELKVEINL